jgi:predicted ribosomally synthesized peptide with nif11-like leader
MSQESLINLVKAVSTDASLRQEFLAAGTLEDKVAVAVSHGFDIRPVELEALRAMAGKESSGNELSGAELDLVTGGLLGEVWSDLKKTAAEVVGVLTGPSHKHISSLKYSD